MKYVLLALLAETLAVISLGFESSITQGFSLKNLALYLLLLFVLLKTVVSGLPSWSRSTQSIALAWFGFLMWASVTLILIRINPLPDHSIVQAGIRLKSDLFDPFFFFVIYYVLSQKSGDAEFLLHSFMLMIALGALVTIGDVFGVAGGVFGYDEDSNRPNGPMGEPNQSAAVFSLFIPIALAQAAFFRRRVFWASVAMVLICALIVTGSRGGFVGGICGIMLTCWLLRHDLSAGRMATFVGGLALVWILVFINLPDTYQEMLMSRFSTTAEAEDLHSASAGRSTVWAAGFEVWLQSPIVGYGWGSFNPLVHHTSHNTYLEFMVELGLIGLILYLLVLACVIVHLRRAGRQLDRPVGIIAKAALGGIAGLSVSVFFVNLYAPWLVVWGFLGVLVGLSARELSLKRAERKRGGNARLHAYR